MKLKLFASAVLVVLLTVGFSYREALGAWFSDHLWQDAQEPIPTLELKRRPYQVKVVADGRLTGLVTTGVSTPKGRSSLKIAWLVDEGTVVQQGDLLVRFDNTDAELALEKNQNEVSTLNHRLDKTQIDRTGTQQRLAKEKYAAELDFAYAQNQIRQDESIFSRWEITDSQVSAELAESRLRHLNGQEALHETLFMADKQILGIERQTAQSEMERAQQTLSSLEVRAPVDGVVLYKRTWRRLEVGGEVWPEQPLMEIATQNRLQAELNVVETEVAGVAVGKPVEATLQALPETTLEGVITSLAQVADQLNQEDPRRYFLASVSLEIPPGQMPKLKPGMRLQGEVLVSDFESTLVVPRSAVFKEDGNFKVFLSHDGQFKEQEVQIEGADHGFYLISGVEEGERVCLRHPFGKENLHLPDFNAPTGPAGGRSFVVFFN